MRRGASPPASSPAPRTLPVSTARFNLELAGLRHLEEDKVGDEEGNHGGGDHAERGHLDSELLQPHPPPSSAPPHLCISAPADSRERQAEREAGGGLWVVVVVVGVIGVVAVPAC
eukprot:2407090-Rhodomonas_salina.1